ncbi:MAG TPA: hypothetical protein VK171_14875 [Fimbriimonas sp.]|nr:hypothetical protein [Fimbriimonas sp.]
MSEAFLCRYALDAFYAFTEDELIHPGAFVLLHSGSGISRWAKTKEGGLVYVCYIGSRLPVWNGAPGALHILNTQHSYEERQVPLESLAKVS